MIAPRNRLRDTPITTGGPTAAIASRCRRSERLCSPVLPNPMPGSMQIASSEMPASCAARTRSARNAATSATTSSYRGSSCIVLGMPRMCMRQTGTPAPATTSAMRGSTRIADTSFTNDAPAAIAASATTAFVRVDRDRHVGRLAQAADHREHARQLDVGRDGIRPRAGRLAADVEQVGAVGDERDAARDRGPGIQVLAAVRERVGRHVDHAHHRRGREPIRQRGHGRDSRMAPPTTRRRGPAVSHVAHRG